MLWKHKLSIIGDENTIGFEFLRCLIEDSSDLKDFWLHINAGDFSVKINYIKN